MLSRLLQKNTNPIETIILKKIKDVIEENLKINYMILAKRSLLITPKTFIEMYANFVLDNTLVDKNLMKLQDKHIGEKNS
jgi:ABC-type iron transport system FetAB ATPase subunit